jgi:hypothetical protein
VFANCAPPRPHRAPRPVSLPAALPHDAPAWLAKDHAYQTAAAHFYAGQYDLAREAFVAIAADKASPWQPWGAYLAARCLLRRATLTNARLRDDPTRAMPAEVRSDLEQARRELAQQAHANDRDAARLIGWVDARLNPAERANELAEQLQRGPIAGADRIGMLQDYLVLMDAIAQKTSPMPWEQSDGLARARQPMTAWIGAMQAAGAERWLASDTSGITARERHAGAMHMVRTWRQRDADVAWLLPLALHARRIADLRDDEIDAMRAVPPSSPAWQTLNWHLARLRLIEGDAMGEVDERVSAALADPTLATSTRNRWLQLKLVSARSIEAFLAAMPRALAEPPRPAGPIPDEGKAAVVADFAQDIDAAPRLYRQLPLAALLPLATVPKPSVNPTDVFARALVLEDWPTADALADEVAAPRKTTQHLYRRLLAARNHDDKRLAAALILVNTPELDPMVFDREGRSRVWGCRRDATYDVIDAFYVDSPAQFIDADAQARAQGERERLEALPVRTRWLAERLLPWAQTRPDDAEAPKALHLLVASTRMECWEPVHDAEKKLPSHSREAYRVLHKHWPKSEWAAKTKYWY